MSLKDFVTASRSFAGKPRSYRIEVVRNFLVAYLDSVGARLAREGGLTGSEISGQGRRKFPSSCSGFHELVRIGSHR
jgi:hypothetical protein